MHLQPINKTRRNLLILTSIVTKIFVAFITVFTFHSFIDTFDYQNYHQAMQNILNGLAPWAGGTSVMFPPLAFIPMMIAYGVSLVGGMMGFIVSMWVLAAICDIITIFCIYWIGLKLYSEQTAFIAAMVYATAISMAYYSLSKFDPFPTCMAMLAILATVYGDKTKGYLASIAGLFIKLWPIVLFPFFWIYNSRKSSLIAEGRKRVALIATISAVIFVGMIVAGYNVLLGYAGLVFCNTIQYTIIQYAQIIGVAIPSAGLTDIFRVILILVIGYAAFRLYTGKKTVSLLLKAILVSLMGLVFLWQYRSPQYIMWFMPVVALLIADLIEGILIFTIVQVLSYIEFPLAFYNLYTNAQYTSPWALVFFTIYFAAYGLLLWQALKFTGPKGVSA